MIGSNGSSFSCSRDCRRRSLRSLFTLSRPRGENSRPEQRAAQYGENGIGDRQKEFFEQLAAGRDPLSADFWKDLGVEAVAFEGYIQAIGAAQEQIEKTFSLMGLGGMARYDASIVRGLAYYTGFVWEISDAQGSNRAAAGGGRYDKLIEMFGGPPLPATGFGMGDVVPLILLQERNRLPSAAVMAAAAGGRPDVYIGERLATGGRGDAAGERASLASQ